MKFKPWLFAITSGITTATIFLIYAGLVYAFPKGSLKIAGALLHIKKLTALKPYLKVTLITSIEGALFCFVSMFIYSVVSIGMYNLFLDAYNFLKRKLS